MSPEFQGFSSEYVTVSGLPAKVLRKKYVLNLNLFRLNPDHFTVAPDNNRITGLFMSLESFTGSGSQRLGYFLQIGNSFLNPVSIMICHSLRTPCV